MIETEVTTRKWGRSIGLVIPKEDAEKLKLGPNERVIITVAKRENPLAELAGTLELDRPLKELLDEVDREGWDD